jgi:hypothetical protein
LGFRGLWAIQARAAQVGGPGGKNVRILEDDGGASPYRDAVGSKKKTKKKSHGKKSKRKSGNVKKSSKMSLAESEEQ